MANPLLPDLSEQMPRELNFNIKHIPAIRDLNTTFQHRGQGRAFANQINNWNNHIKKTIGSMNYVLKGMQDFNRLGSQIPKGGIADTTQLNTIKSKMESAVKFQTEYSDYIKRITHNIETTREFGKIPTVKYIKEMASRTGGFYHNVKLSPGLSGEDYGRLGSIKSEYAKLDKSVQNFNKAVQKFENPVAAQTGMLGNAIGLQMGSSIAQIVASASQQAGDYFRGRAARTVSQGGNIGEAITDSKWGTGLKVTGNIVGDIGGMALMGAGVGSMVPVFGTILGAGVGAGIGAGIGVLSGGAKTFKDILDDNDTRKELRGLFKTGWQENLDAIEGQNKILNNERMVQLFKDALGPDIEKGIWKRNGAYNTVLKDKSEIEDEVKELKTIRDNNFKEYEDKAKKYSELKENKDISEKELSDKLNELNKLKTDQTKYNDELEEATKELEAYNKILQTIKTVSEKQAELEKQRNAEISKQKRFEASNEGHARELSYNLTDISNRFKNDTFNNLMNSMEYSEKYGYRTNHSFYAKQGEILKNRRRDLIGEIANAEVRSTGSDYDKTLLQTLNQNLVELEQAIKENTIKEKTEKSEIYNLKEKLTEQNNAHALQNILNNKNFKVSDLAPEWHRLSKEKTQVENELKEVDKWEESTAKRQRQFDLRNKLASIVGGMNDITGLRIQSASEKMNNLMGSSFLTDNFGSFSKWAGRQNPMSVMVKEQNGLLKKILRELQLEKMSVPLFAR